MANATLRIWWFTNYAAHPAFGPIEVGLGMVSDPYWFIQGRRPMKAFGLGHASLYVPPGAYISWGGATSAEEDTERYKVQPETVDIPLADQGTKFGLQGNAIVAWYDNTWRWGPGYNALSRNCCDCVVGALTAGGGLSYSQIGTKWLGDDGARTVLNWANRIRAKVLEMNRGWQTHWNEAKLMIEQGRATAGHAAIDELRAALPARAAGVLAKQVMQAESQKWSTVPTLAEWKKRSAVLVGYRKEQILQIDKLMGEYDDQKREDPRLRSVLAVGRKLNTLKSILWWAADHLCAKRSSDRRGAVLPLASAAWAEHNRTVEANRCGTNGGRLAWDPIT
jgi:hypothetical protein